MAIAGLLKVSLIDFPGHVSAVVFVRGCPFRCFYCHNPELVLPERYASEIDTQAILEFLKRRAGKLDGVCITGGEATVWDGLDDFVRSVAALGYAIKLDTNGFFPDRVERLLATGLLSYVAMDIKAPLDRYADIVHVRCDGARIHKSIDLIMRAHREGLVRAYEFRTTLVKPVLTPDDAHGIGEAIRGAETYVVQNFVSSKHVGDVSAAEPFSDQEKNLFVDFMRPYVRYVKVR